jgi:hypothetical protein
MNIGYIENFLSLDEIEWFCWYWEQLPTQVDNGQRKFSWAHFDQPFFSEIKQRLNKKIKNHNQNEEITTINLNWDYAPGGIHSDGFLEHDKQDKIANTYLTPIVMDCDYQTILFDQQSKPAVTLNQELGLGDNGITTYKQVNRDYFPNLSNKKFSKDVYDRYLTHLNYNALRGFNVIAVQEWKLGRAMYWPREQLHCSANFDKGVGRSSLLIVTKYVE